jgi:hypothetical protein
VIVMAQYLLAIRRDYAVPLAPEATGQKWADINALIDRMTDAGAFVFQGGLRGGAGSATVVRQSGDDFLMTDGPYAETKEHLAGFFIVNAADLDEALEWAKLAAAAQQRPIEVRPFFDGDLDDAILGSVREAEAEVIWRDASGAR